MNRLCQSKTLFLFSVLYIAPAQAAEEALITFAIDEEKLELRGTDIADAAPMIDQASLPVVSFQMSKDVARAFGDLTSRHVGKQMDLIVCGKLMSSPVIMEPIYGGGGMITGNFTVEDTVKLARQLKAGSCAPVPI